MRHESFVARGPPAHRTGDAVLFVSRPNVFAHVGAALDKRHHAAIYCGNTLGDITCGRNFDEDDNMPDTHDDHPTPVRELSTDPFIQSIYQRYAALIEGTGTVTTDDFFAKNPDQVLADLSLLFGYIRGLERAARP